MGWPLQQSQKLSLRVKRSNLTRRVIPSAFTESTLSVANVFSVNSARNLAETASAESTLSEANVTRNDTVCRIATPSRSLS